MPRASHPFDTLLEHAAQLIAARIDGLISRGPGKGATRAPGGMSANEKRSRAMKGRKLDMRCRVKGCKNRSGGPGKGYICKDHQRLPEKEQQAARDAWKARQLAQVG